MVPWASAVDNTIGVTPDVYRTGIWASVFVSSKLGMKFAILVALSGARNGPVDCLAHCRLEESAGKKYGYRGALYTRHRHLILQGLCDILYVNRI
jgi:hypothetical protein